MISLRELTLARAGRVLIEGASAQIHAGQKIGLVGANGSGKSSLFALLRDELHAEAGDLHVPPAWVVAHVAQETPALPAAAIEHVLDGDAELRRVEAQIAAAEAAHQGEALALAHEHYGRIGGYGARSRAAALLAGLGFADRDFARPVAEFSGGWRVRLNVARALMCRSDLLLLDEPTNHLDLDAVLWLEGWLRAYAGTLLVISHDREFLDNVVGFIAHIDQRRLRLYRGNYADFEAQRAAQLAGQQAMYEAQQREMAHLHRYIDRFRAKATKARQAQSRIKALARMEVLTAAHVDTPFTFRFAEPESSPERLLEIEEASVGYAQKPVLTDVHLDIRSGARIGLLGRNGAGKSTLVKLLAGELAPLAGARHEGKGLAIGYFAQHQVERLRPDESPLWHLTRLDANAREQSLRDYLGGFNFRGDMATAPVGPFSGGEKSRLALALLIWTRPNLLLLDEPTNHLDLEMRHALNLALQEFEGAVVLVSHDRHLLRTTSDSFVLVADGRASAFDGDLDDYAAWLQTPVSASEEAPKNAGRRAQRQVEAQQRALAAARRKPLESEIAGLEARLTQLAADKRDIDAELADPLAYRSGDGAALQARFKRQAELQRDIDAAEERWLALHEALERC